MMKAVKEERKDTWRDKKQISMYIYIYTVMVKKFSNYLRFNKYS